MAQPNSSPNHDSPSRAAALPPGVRIAAVVSSYHEEIGAMMLESARRELESCGLARDNFFEVHSPGAFELPLIARRLAVRDDIHAVLCFGLVLKGETSHDTHIATSVAHGILLGALQTDTPILFGVLTCATLEQALARALPAEQGGLHDKGREVARAATLALEALKLASEIGVAARGTGFFRREADAEVRP
ncbi:MAG TPA: 6,7-dimethyl-8-ribityllumazine synthase [Planctomycetota bacterium]|nr:6,7-dimethyl-8-ribityllumazine synthase [Planctomycetota bacterium]